MAVTPQTIDAYLRDKGSPLTGYGHVFVEAGANAGVDPRLLVSIMGAESSFGKKLYGQYNPFGWGPGKSFGSFGDAINTVAQGLKSGYIDQGLTTVPQIGSKWAPVGASNDPSGLNNNWTKNVANFYREMGGRASKPVAFQAKTGPVTTGNGSPVGGNIFKFSPDVNSMFALGAKMTGVTPLGPLKSPNQGRSDVVKPPMTRTLASGASHPAVVSTAMQYLGVPYVWGGETPKGFDCSGLVQYTMAQNGIKVPRVTYDQFRAGTAVPVDQLKPGDAVFFKGSDPKKVNGQLLPGHVGLYVGNGQFIEAPKRGTPVRVSSLSSRGDFMGARRY